MIVDGLCAVSWVRKRVTVDGLYDAEATRAGRSRRCFHQVREQVVFSPGNGTGSVLTRYGSRWCFHQVREQVVFSPGARAGDVFPRYGSRWCFHQVQEQMMFSPGTGAGGVFTRYGSRWCFPQIREQVVFSPGTGAGGVFTRYAEQLGAPSCASLQHLKHSNSRRSWLCVGTCSDEWPKLYTSVFHLQCPLPQLSCHLSLWLSTRRASASSGDPGRDCLGEGLAK